MIEYDVITTPTSKELIMIIQYRLDTGWALQGGISIAPDEFGIMMYAQAITRDTI